MTQLDRQIQDARSQNQVSRILRAEGYSEGQADDLALLIMFLIGPRRSYESTISLIPLLARAHGRAEELGLIEGIRGPDNSRLLALVASVRKRLSREEKR